MELNCKVCTNRVSDLAMATGKAVIIKGEIYHTTCVEGRTIKEIEKGG